MASVREGFDRAVTANRELLDDLDAALVECGRALADHIDAGAEGSVYLAPHLMNVLREMYATPKARLDAGIGKEGAGGKLAAVRDLRSRPAPSKKRVS